MLKSWPNISALTYMELVAASGTINQSMLAYCHYFDIVIALMYLDIQGDYFQMVYPLQSYGPKVITPPKKRRKKKRHGYNFSFQASILNQRGAIRYVLMLIQWQNLKRKIVAVSFFLDASYFC